MAKEVAGNPRWPIAVWFGAGVLIGMAVMFAWLRWGTAAAAGREVSVRPPRAIRPRTEIETSGLSAVLESVDPWTPGSSLEEIADIWRGVGHRNVKRITKTLETERLSERERTRLMASRAMFLNYEGDVEGAAKALAELREYVENSPSLTEDTLQTVIFLQAVTAMRLGENENCIMCRGESSCILPIAPSAVHENQRGSRQAIAHLHEILDDFPDDFGARWLLNLAHMTLGEYPDAVDPRFRVSLDHFLKSEFDLGRFRDVGHLVGVNTLNQAGGVAMDDFDGDGYLDVILTSIDPSAPMRMFQNARDGTFTERGDQAGLAGQLGGLFCCQADFDNDGHLDLFVARGAWFPFPVRPSLLRNRGDGTFEDVTESAGVGIPFNTNSAAWADYDNDGWVDLFVPGELAASLLYRNKGDGTFEEVAFQAGVDTTSRTWCKGATWIDYDNDGYPDLYVSTLGNGSMLFRNRGDGRFEDVTLQMGIQGPRFGFACWAWDYDNDGWVDLFATSYERSLESLVGGMSGQTPRHETTRLYRNINGERFEDVSKPAGVALAFATMGCNYGDFDNDGYLDMYLGTGDPSLDTLVPNRMFRNVDGKRFAEITASSGTGHLQKGHAVGCGDWDRDGDVDIFIQMGGATPGDQYHNILFQNPGQGNRSVTVRLVGKKTHRSAHGARIQAYVGGEPGRMIHRVISSGSSFGANPLEETIGLGQDRQIDRLVITWPTSGSTQEFRDIPAGKIIEITEFEQSYRTLDLKPLAIQEIDTTPGR